MTKSKINLTIFFIIKTLESGVSVSKASGSAVKQART